MPNFHAIYEDGIEAQFDLEGAQREVHLEDFFTDSDGAVLAHDAFEGRRC